MGLADSKKNVFTTISSYTSLIQRMQTYKPPNYSKSANNSKEIVPFLINILKTAVGSAALKEVVGKLLTDFVDNANSQLRIALKNQITSQYNSDEPLSASFKGEGIKVPVSTIDTYGKFKTSPGSSGGNLIYGSDDGFDSTAYNAISNEGSDVAISNMTINYDSLTDSFTFKPNSLSIGSDTTVGGLFGDYIDSVEIINKKEFVSNTMDKIFGTITSTQNKSAEEILKELEIDKMIENAINGDDSFELSPAEYEELRQRAENLKNGTNQYDMGCGMMSTYLPISGLTDLVNQISGSTDFNAVGNAVENTLDQSMSGNEDNAAENKESIRDGFFERLIKEMSITFIKSMTTAPQVRMIMSIISAFKNGEVDLKDVRDDLKKYKTLIMCLIKEALKMFVEYIFNLTIAILLKLVEVVIKKIVKEKITQYVGIMKSFAG